jgi:tetratricopeptide (TPR) repeat protein
MNARENFGFSHEQYRSIIDSGFDSIDMGNFDSATRIFEGVLALNPADSAALSGLGFIAESNGDLASAEKYLEAAVEANPEGCNALLRLGKLRLTRQDSSAWALFERASKGDGASSKQATQILKTRKP